ncbi:MAG TPA: prepilin-type N-terminal cleavage/methylation domain-containing protein [Polyangiaceae bacterium]|nr:prepilin-type N-terminal cleavage/methylation domain-containing protein [Polyangiaceae bacterium]
MNVPAAAGHFLRSKRLRASRGFTLVELMVVVLIVAILAVIAVPSVVERMRERRSSEAAQRIAGLYRGARMRAMGRGSAVMVSYDQGSFIVREAVRPPPADNPQCTGEPWSSCTNNDWSNTKNYSELSRFAPTKRSEYEGLTLAAIPSTTTRIDICFTPMGRAYTRADNLPFSTPMVQVASFNVGRSGSAITRTVMVLPNGVARVAL